MNKLTEDILRTEFSEEFIQKMKNSMVVGYYEHGSVLTSKTDTIKSAEQCVILYEKTGNTKYLIDGANCFMMEYMRAYSPEREDRGDTPISAIKQEDDD